MKTTEEYEKEIKKSNRTIRTEIIEKYNVNDFEFVDAIDEIIIIMSEKYEKEIEELKRVCFQAQNMAIEQSQKFKDNIEDKRHKTESLPPKEFKDKIKKGREVIKSIAFYNEESEEKALKEFDEIFKEELK